MTLSIYLIFLAALIITMAAGVGLVYSIVLLSQGSFSDLFSFAKWKEIFS